MHETRGASAGNESLRPQPRIPCGESLGLAMSHKPTLALRSGTDHSQSPQVADDLQMAPSCGVVFLIFEGRAPSRIRCIVPESAASKRPTILPRLNPFMIHSRRGSALPIPVRSSTLLLPLAQVRECHIAGRCQACRTACSMPLANMAELCPGAVVGQIACHARCMRCDGPLGELVLVETADCCDYARVQFNPGTPPHDQQPVLEHSA